ncbi:MAG: NCS2 family permease, partial [Clostridia bacterium]|nr:NCS2 family permease [Clostridia bacterium]
KNVPEPETSEQTSESVENSQPAAADAAAPATPHKGFFGKLDKFFGITKSGSNFKTEIIAGLTTFMAMVYILIVNPNMFAMIPGLSFQGMYIATALGAIVGTLLMAFLARMPLAQASGMGVNAFVVFNLVLFGGLTYANAMVFTLLDGIIFVILTVTGLRKYIFRAIPDEVRKAINVGLGLFIAFIGLQNAGVIVNNDSTLVNLASFNVLSADFVTYASGTVGGMLPALVAILGVIIIAVLEKKKIRGSILWGILGSAVLFYIFAGFACIAGGADLVTYTFKASEIANVDLSTIMGSVTSAQSVVDGETVTLITVSSLPADMFKSLFGAIPDAASHFYTNGLAAKQIFTSISLSNPFQAFAAWGTESVGKVFTDGFNFGSYLDAGNSVGSLVLLLITSALSLCMLDMFDTLGTLYGACSKGGLLDKEGNPMNM